MVALSMIFLSSLSFFVTADASSSENVSNASSSFDNATTYNLAYEWGSEGDEDGQFVRPHDLDFSPSEDKLYVVDRDNFRIQVFNKTGAYLFEWGSEGDGKGEFTLPYGLDVDKKGNVWVADRFGARIQKFDAEGKFLLEFGSKGDEEGQFRQPRHVAVDDALQYVYVADSRNDRIQKFDINGNFIASFGTEGNQSGQFNLPTTVVIDSHGDLYVNERGNERIQKLDTKGNPILMWGSRGSAPNQFCHMEHLGIDKYDNIYVTDPQSDPGCSNQAAVKKFDSQGNFITQWIIPSEEENGPDPEHLAIDTDGNVYISARGLNKILVYAPITNGNTSRVTAES